jgi:hypothetical protein
MKTRLGIFAISLVLLPLSGKDTQAMQLLRYTPPFKLFAHGLVLPVHGGGLIVIPADIQ